MDLSIVVRNAAKRNDTHDLRSPLDFNDHPVEREWGKRPQMRSNGNCRGISYRGYAHTGNTATAVPVTVLNQLDVGEAPLPPPLGPPSVRLGSEIRNVREADIALLPIPDFLVFSPFCAARKKFRAGRSNLVEKDERRRRKKKGEERGGGRRSGSRGTRRGRGRGEEEEKKEETAERARWRCEEEEEERIGIAAAVETRFTVVVGPIDT